MTTLHLIDLDNLLPISRTTKVEEQPTRLKVPKASGKKIAWLTDTLDLPQASIGPSAQEDLDALVVMAFNQFTMREVHNAASKACNNPSEPKTTLGLEYLARLAYSAARCAESVNRVVVEICPCLIMPESSDVALMTLLEHAPTSTHCGPFKSVWLWTSDKDLRRSILSKLVNYGAQICVSSPLTTTNLKKELIRKPPPTVTLQSTTPETLPSGLSVPVETEGQCLSAAGFAVELDPGGITLAALSKRIEEKPHILSQIGLTVTSARGLRRFQEYSDKDEMKIGTCSPNDGLFVENNLLDEPPSELSRMQPASTGIGAVHFSKARITVRTRLPHGILKFAKHCFEDIVDSKTTRLPDKKVLDALPEQINLSEKCQLNVKWGFSTNDSGIEIPQVHARIELPFGEQPACWWLKYGRKTSTHESTTEMNFRIVRSKQMSAYLQCLRGELVFSFGVQKYRVDLFQEIAPWSIKLLGPSKSPRLLFTGGAPLLPGRHHAIGIQKVPFESVQTATIGFDAAHWTRLQRFPLLVPCCQTSEPTCVCRVGGEK